jgi:integrase
MAAAEPIRKKEDVQALANYFIDHGEYRNLVLFIMGVHTALRISYLLKLDWNDVYDFKARRLRTHITLMEQKTDKPARIALDAESAYALTDYFSRVDKPTAATPLFINNKTGKAIGRVQAYRIIHEAGEAINLPYPISCHSLRKTFGYHSWQEDVPTPVVMEIYNHSSYGITRRYLGVTQDDKDAAYQGMCYGLNKAKELPYQSRPVLNKTKSARTN